MRIDINKKVTDVKIDLLEEPAPEDQLEAEILVALYHIGQQSSDKQGFWIRAGDVVKWLEANGYEAKSENVGHVITRKYKLGTGINEHKRMASGVYRWISRDRLMKLIEKYNEGIVQKVHEDSFKDRMKRIIFQAYTDGVDIMSIPEIVDCDEDLVRDISREYFKLSEEEVRKWLEEAI